MRIGSLDTADRVLLIAEVGNNHEGNIDVARELVVRAAEAGADAIKFQTFKTELFVSASDQARFDRLKSFELTFEQFGELAELARSNGLLFISTPLDLESAAFLGGVVDILKIASGDNDFYPLIARVAASGKPLIVSAGLSELDDIARTVDFVREQPNASPELGVLHCVSAYPAPANEVNLRAIESLSAVLDCTIGYSDHTIGIEAAALSVGLGARIVEKHFTLDHDFSDFRDHQLSADPGELAELARRIREADVLLGAGGKAIQPAEEPGQTAMRRSIVAARDLPEGHVVTEADLMWIRPGGGIAPGEEHRLVGRALVRDRAFAEQLLQDDVE